MSVEEAIAQAINDAHVDFGEVDPALVLPRLRELGYVVVPADTVEFWADHATELAKALSVVLWDEVGQDAREWHPQGKVLAAWEQALKQRCEDASIGRVVMDPDGTFRFEPKAQPSDGDGS